ncbi:cation/H(+) antiporter 3-like [Mercurialis annua]|uniref:cation/H(+) antiporter 3-like n=1 Tax=Mercurialis annua TaxID=3986 RepID=UPI00215E309A|nr:cation/H(+) antiporter 3-like [Mercurialis annua]
MDTNIVKPEFLAKNASFVTATFCFSLDPPMINSHGIFNNTDSPADFLKFSLPLLELQIALICIVYQAIHFFLKHIGITSFVSQILAGLVLGPTCLGRLDFMRRVIFPHDSQEVISTFALIGFQMFLFLSAVKLDAGVVLKSGKIVMFSGIGIVILPLLSGFFVVFLNVANLSATKTLYEAGIVVIMQCFTTLSIIAHVLDELNLANTEIGRLALSTALIGDMLCIVVMSVTIATVDSSMTNMFVGSTAIVIYILAAVFIFRPSVSWIMRQTPQGSPVESTYIYFIIIVVIASEIYFKFFRQGQCIGPLVLGLFIRAGSPLGSAIIEKFEGFVLGVLMPLAVTTSILRADLSLILWKFSEIKLYLLLMALPSITKFISCLVPALYWKMPIVDSLIFSVIMTSRGNMELTAYILARDILIVTDDVFAVLVLCLLINSTFVGIFVKYFYDPARKYAGYQVRNIRSLKPKSEMRILTCIYKDANITSTLKLLDSFHPNVEKPLDVYVLHLLQLIGRDTPILISHENRQPVNESSSHNVIIAFNQFKQNNWDSVSVSAFTAISPLKSMNEDLSILALDKIASFILLPLHRRWSIHGSIIEEDSNIRNINCKVLEKAPCSVAVFFDRGKLGRRSSTTVSEAVPLSICMIFMGGSDDREALSLAKRIAKDSNANLTVVNLLPSIRACGKNPEDEMIDSWAMENAKRSKENGVNLRYKEQMVKDGPETALQIHSIVDEFDLFLVGRRFGVESPQTLGLEKWAEIPELGIIGDLLASKDFNTRAAVLVVQEQKQMK